MNKITPFLWFNGKAEEAANFYVSIFNDSKIEAITYYGEAGPGPKDSVMSVIFHLDGQELYALNGGPMFTFTPAISLFVDCTTQDEVDHFWEKLSKGGEKHACGWLQDKFGVSWQVVPAILNQMMQDKNPDKVKHVMQAMMKMDKLDIALLKQAYER